MRHHIVVSLGVVALWAAAASILAIFAGAKWRSTNREQTQALEKALRDKTVDPKKWAEEQLRQEPVVADEDLPAEAVG
jgi:hypothetical protein